MNKHVYISADYAVNNGDRDVVEVLHAWGRDNYHKVDYIDTAEVVSGSIANDSDCRPCDLKKEFNNQINASSVVIFIVGDKTKDRIAGNSCKRNDFGEGCGCTPYKQNSNGNKTCKIYGATSTPGADDDVGEINTFSYLRHEFEQAKKKNKKIIIVYNSIYKQPDWLPSYMNDYEKYAQPFWKRDGWGQRVGNYFFIKKALGYE